LTLWQPQEPAFWLFCLTLAATATLQLGEQSLLRQLSPGGWALAWVLVALYALPVIWLVYALDLYEREPTSLLVAAFAWGAIAATTLAGLGNDGWGQVVARVGGPEFAARWTAALTAPFVEEIVKGLGVVLIALIARDEIDDVMDGFVYGAIAGLGFAVVEDVFYLVGVFGGSLDGVLEGFLFRVVASGLYGHVLYSGLVGMAVGLVASGRGVGDARQTRLVAAGLCTAAVAGHFLWNSPLLDLFPDAPVDGAELLLVPLATAVKGLPLVVVVVLGLGLARRREERWLDAALGPEVGFDGVSLEEFRILREPSRRRAARRVMRRRAGAGAARLLVRLQREQVNLAMARAKAADPADPRIAAQRTYCRSLRDALLAIPGAAPAGDASAEG
jgi:RsiW-degrading membrane proteinase PrsW (M82 family)